MFLVILLFVVFVSAAAGFKLGAGRGAFAVSAVLLVGLGLAIAAFGSEVLLVAAYAGGPLIIVGGLALAVGAHFHAVE